MATTADKTISGAILRVAEILALMEPAREQDKVIRDGMVRDLQVAAQTVEVARADVLIAARNAAHAWTHCGRDTFDLDTDFLDELVVAIFEFDEIWTTAPTNQAEGRA
jgi:hypothetical protein